MARDIGKIKFNALDTNTNEYIKYDDWRNENGYKHNNESLGKFLDEHFGCTILQYVEFNDKNGNEIYEDNKVKIIFKDVENIATVESYRGTFCFKFESGNIIPENTEDTKKYLPISYIMDSVTDDVEIIKRFK